MADYLATHIYIHSSLIPIGEHVHDMQRRPRQTNRAVLKFKFRGILLADFGLLSDSDPA